MHPPMARAIKWYCRKALEEIQKLKERAKRAKVLGNREYNPGWHTAMDLPNLLSVAEAVTRAGLQRKESRGAQFRNDFPAKNDGEFGKANTIIFRGDDGSMKFRFEPILEMPAELKKVIDENK